MADQFLKHLPLKFYKFLALLVATAHEKLNAMHIVTCLQYITVHYHHCTFVKQLDYVNDEHGYTHSGVTRPGPTRAWALA